MVGMDQISSSGIKVRQLKVCTNAMKRLAHCLSVASKFTPKVKGHL